MKKTVVYKGNTFTYTLHDCRNEGNGKKGYVAFVDLLKGCVTSTPTNDFRKLEKQVRSAIKEWIEPTSLNVAKRQRLEQLERLVASKDYFCKALAENFSDELVNKGFKQWGMGYSYLNDNKYKIASDAFTAGIKYALKAQSEGQ